MARKNTRFGEQPIRGVVRKRHWNLRLIAYETGVAYSHLINAANGITPPSPQLRRTLSAFLDLPIEKLFTADALAAKYNEGRPLGGKISRRYGRRAAWSGTSKARCARREQKLATRHVLTPDCRNTSKITKRFSEWLSC